MSPLTDRAGIYTKLKMRFPMRKSQGIPVIRIRGYHTDLYGHVNNARYLEFLEEGRWCLFEDFMDLQTFITKGYSFFVVNINISYRRSIELDETIEIRSGILRYGNRSAVLRQKIYLQGTDTLCADADVTFVVLEKNREGALSLSGEIRDRLASLPELA